MKNSTKYMMYLILIMSTVIVMSSNNWMSMWMGMEINLIAFLPIMFKSKNNLSSEGMMMYFMIQAMGSIIMLMSILMNTKMFIEEANFESMTKNILFTSIIMKMGSAPLHFWMPEIMEKMNWMNCMILMTWQKIAPMIMLSNIFINKNMIMAMTIMGTIVGAMGGLNQTSIRKIMAYSSISHIAWMIMCMTYNNEMWMYYLTIYSIMIIMTTMVFKTKSIMYLNQMMTENMTLMEKMNIVMLFMSMGGMPPFLGFLPKWMVIQSTFSSTTILTLTIMVTSTLMTLYYYMKMMSTNIMINISMNKWNMNMKKSKILQTNILLLNITLPLMMMLVTF